MRGGGGSSVGGDGWTFCFLDIGVGSSPIFGRRSTFLRRGLDNGVAKARESELRSSLTTIGDGSACLVTSLSLVLSSQLGIESSLGSKGLIFGFLAWLESSCC